MLEEYYIWNKIFKEEDELKLKNLIKLVVEDEDARELVFENLINLKQQPNQMIKLTVNVDKDIKDYPVTSLANSIVKEIIKKLDE